MCNSSITSASSRFNTYNAEVLTLVFLYKGDPIQGKLNKAAIEFEGCIDYKLLILLGHKLCLV